MTVDATYIAAISRDKYTVGTGSAYTIPETTLTLFLSWATDRITQDVPSGNLTATQIDQAKALLVCHYIEMGASDKTSETIDNYSYSRQTGGSPWLAEYLALVSQATMSAAKATLKASTGVTRADATLSTLKWDRNTGGI